MTNVMLAIGLVLVFSGVFSTEIGMHEGAGAAGILVGGLILFAWSSFPQY